MSELALHQCVCVCVCTNSIQPEKANERESGIWAESHLKKMSGCWTDTYVYM